MKDPDISKYGGKKKWFNAFRTGQWLYSLDSTFLSLFPYEYKWIKVIWIHRNLQLWGVRRPLTNFGVNYCQRQDTGKHHATEWHSHVIILWLRNSRLLQQLGCVTLHSRQSDRSSVPKTFSHFSAVRNYSWDLLSLRTGAYSRGPGKYLCNMKRQPRTLTPPLLHYHHSKNHYSSCFTPKVKCRTEKAQKNKTDT